jgi:hypothetical protein
MFVVLLVTGIAIHRRIFVPLLGVAVFAFDDSMLPTQRIPCLIVVKLPCRFFPVLFNVATCTGGPQVPFVLVVFLVTRIAIRWRIAKLRLGFVAGLAFNLLPVRMGTLEGEIRSFVVESLIGYLSNILPTASVFCMAVLAFTLLLETSMRTLFGVDILPHVFVTIQAQTALRRFVEPLVTLGAVFFPFGMPFDHLAWHEDGFDIVGPGVTREDGP